MNQQKLEEEFNKRFPNKESGYIDKNGNNVWIFFPAVDAKELKQFISDNYIPKAEVEHLIIQAEAKGAEQAIETFEKVPKPNSTN